MFEHKIPEDSPPEQVHESLRAEAMYLAPTAVVTNADRAAIVGGCIIGRFIENDYDADWRVRRIREEARAAAHYGILALQAVGRW